VVVTAQKRSERLVDVPISVAVLDAAQLENAGIQGFQDIDKVAVGTRINRVGIYFQPSIRGITTQVVGVGQENNVAVYVDGFYQPSQVGINTDFDNVKSVQVLKGPQGTLFGRNATGGAILIDTLDPSFTPTAKASVSYGRFNEVIGQGYFSNGLTGKLAFDVSAYWKRSDGYIKDIGGFDTNPLRDRSLRSKLLFAAKVGTGFDRKLLKSLHDKFQALVRKDCPFANLPEKLPNSGAKGITASEMRFCTWLEPELVCQVRFAEWTRDHHLRQPAFLGLREDKRPNEIVAGGRR